MFADFAEQNEQDEELTRIGAINTPQPKVEEAEELPPGQRIETLFVSMPKLQRVLRGIIEFCREPQSPASVDERTKELTRYDYTIYSPITLRELLEQAGALEYLRAPDDNARAEPKSEQFSDTQGNYDLEYFEIGESSEGQWLATEAALDFIGGHDPKGSLEQLLRHDHALLDIYQKILGYCSEDGGRTIAQIDKLIEGDPRLLKPRKYGGYFVERLEAVEALLWKGAWVTSDMAIHTLRAIASDVNASAVHDPLGSQTDDGSLAATHVENAAG